MRARVLLTLIIAITWSACMWGKPGATQAGFSDTLKYSYQHFKQRASDCGNKPDSACTVITIDYPVFTTKTALSDTLSYRLTNMFEVSKTPINSFAALAKSFMDNYKADLPESNLTHQLQESAKVIRQDSAVLSVELSGYLFQGGAHGSSNTTFINWDYKSGKHILLKDILIDGYQQQLKTIAEKIFRTDENLSPTASLVPNYFFKDGKFSLNDNYSITPFGIRFLYNEYEIKPYAAGTTELFIPYTQIKTLLRPNTVVSQYIK